jgi:hypothetical protein
MMYIDLIQFEIANERYMLLTDQTSVPMKFEDFDMTTVDVFLSQYPTFDFFSF